MELERSGSRIRSILGMFIQCGGWVRGVILDGLSSGGWGYDDRPDDWEDRAEDDEVGDDDNRANQLNPNNDAYRSSRGGASSD